jgi:hypothetical protein
MVLMPRVRAMREALNRKELAGEIRDVTEVQDFRFRRDGLLDAGVEIVGGRRHRELRA